MMRLRIVHFQAYMGWSAGGIMRMVRDLCAVLARRGHDVRLLTCHPDDVPGEWMQGVGEGRPRVTVLPPPDRFGRLRRKALVSAGHVMAGADALHLHAPWTASNPQLAKVARRHAIPYVLTVHGMLDDWSMAQRQLKKRLYLRLFGRRLIDRASAVHCTAEAELQQARKWFSNRRVVVLPCLFDLTELQALPGRELASGQFPIFAEAEPKVLFLSRLHAKKGLEVLLRAAALLRDRGQRPRVVVAGDGDPAYVASLRSLVAELGFNHDDTVTFLGLVTGAMKLSVYQAADVFALPTSQENYGLVLPEALGCGTPVVTTRGVDIWREMQEAGATIIDVPPTPESLADALQPLLADPALRRELGERGRQWVLANLDTQRLVEQYETMYAGLRNFEPCPIT
jgi:glycosyltransferase involved in cell wall biosynthesis